MAGWLPVEPPPAAVLAAMESRARRIRPALSAVGAALIGCLVGYVVLALYPGAGGWHPPARVELFLGVAIAAALVEFVVTVRYLEWLDRKLRIQPVRIAIEEGRLRGELPTGQTFDFPLRRIQLTREPVAAEWYAVTVPMGRMQPYFLVPAPVAAQIRNAAPFGR